ncbi:MAG: acetyl-CoA carboxylase carboxyl transferase subunit beta [Planctomycetota bacterium]|jgi:acetyl-CoA carboxylase carboxyl transferase subunit beta
MHRVLPDLRRGREGLGQATMSDSTTPELASDEVNQNTSASSEQASTELQTTGDEKLSSEEGKDGAESKDGAEQGASKDGVRKRRLWKKKDMPGGLWLKCESCGDTIFRKELEEKMMVCPACNFHFTISAAQRIEMVLDPGTWDERFSELTALDRLEFTDKVPYAEKIEKTSKRLEQNEALLCGFGEIEGQRLVLAILDFKFMGGSMGEVVGEKISLAAELAMTNKLPLLIFTSSGGARMHEGMLSLMQMAKTCAALHQLNANNGFSICVMTNPTTGGVTASFASVCDITLSEPGSLIGFAGPRVIATTLKQELPAGFQRAEFLLAKGQLDAIISRPEMRTKLKSLIDFGRGAWAQSS